MDFLLFLAEELKSYRDFDLHHPSDIPLSSFIPIPEDKEVGPVDVSDPLKPSLFISPEFFGQALPLSRSIPKKSTLYDLGPFTGAPMRRFDPSAADRNVSEESLWSLSNEIFFVVVDEQSFRERSIQRSGDARAQHLDITAIELSPWSTASSIAVLLSQRPLSPLGSGFCRESFLSASVDLFICIGCIKSSFVDQCSLSFTRPSVNEWFRREKGSAWATDSLLGREESNRFVVDGDRIRQCRRQWFWQSFKHWTEQRCSDDRWAAGWFRTLDYTGIEQYLTDTIHPSFVNSDQSHHSTDEYS